MEDFLVANAVYDEPSRYDYLWSDYVEWEWEKKKFCEWFKLKVRNQNANKDTMTGCSAYWLTYIYNGNQLMEFAKEGIEFEQEDPRWKWLAFQNERGYLNSWASLQEMMDFFKKRGLIDGYVRCRTAQECRNALNNWFGIYTGSNKCSWKLASKEKKFVYDINWAAHCFAVVDYDDNGLIAINSFGENWWDKGYFYIPDDDYKNIFSTYAIIDHDDTWKLDNLKFNMEYQKAIEMWITNGVRPDDKMTRKEWAVQIYRMYKILKEW